MSALRKYVEHVPLVTYTLSIGGLKSFLRKLPIASWCQTRSFSYLCKRPRLLNTFKIENGILQFAQFSIIFNTGISGTILSLHQAVFRWNLFLEGYRKCKFYSTINFVLPRRKSRRRGLLQVRGVGDEVAGRR